MPPHESLTFMGICDSSSGQGLLQSTLHAEILMSAQDKGVVRIVGHNLRDYSTDRRKTTDD